MPPERGPIVPRRRLGAELRELRERAGLRIEDVAAALECSVSKVSRLETGKGIPKGRDIRDLLDRYNVPAGQTRDRLMSLAQDGRRQGWWREFSDVLAPDAQVPSHLEAYVSLENDASEIRGFQDTAVHGLLQTEEYARSVLEVFSSRFGEREVRRLLELRMRRQRAVLERSPAIRLHFVFDESVLHRSVGGPAVMTDQLRYLAEAGHQPNITIQVLPYAAGAHKALVGSFAVLLFDDEADHDVVYLESHAGQVFLEGESDVRRHDDLFDDVVARSLDPVNTAGKLSDMIRDNSLSREEGSVP